MATNNTNSLPDNLSSTVQSGTSVTASDTSDVTVDLSSNNVEAQPVVTKQNTTVILGGNNGASSLFTNTAPLLPSNSVVAVVPPLPSISASAAAAASLRTSPVEKAVLADNSLLARAELKAEAVSSGTSLPANPGKLSDMTVSEVSSIPVPELSLMDMLKTAVLKFGSLTLRNLPMILTKLMELIEKESDLGGINKKTIVLDTLEQLVNDLPLSDEEKSSFKMFVKHIAPGMIDAVIAASKGKFKLNIDMLTDGVDDLVKSGCCGLTKKTDKKKLKK